MGDRVISVEGIAVEELPLYSRWPRSLAPNAGDMRRLVVEREGEPVTVEIVYAPRTVGMLQLGALLVTLFFMGSGLWAIFTVPTLHARMLAHIGIVAGVCVLVGGGPYLGTWDGVKMHIDVAAVVLWTLLLLRFFLTFPEPKRVGRSRIATGVLYAPWVLIVGCLVLELIFHPKLYHAFGTPIGLAMLAYLLLALAALVHTLFFTARGRLRETGVSLILWGVLIAVVPTVVGTLAFMFRLPLPGAAYYPLALAAFPIALALAVRRQAQVAAFETE
jgi:hypothetical protein